MSYDDTVWSLIDFETPKKAEMPTVEKGQCPKCGKHIGKGVHFHVKSCDGNIIPDLGQGVSG